MDPQSSVTLHMYNNIGTVTYLVSLHADHDTGPPLCTKLPVSDVCPATVLRDAVGIYKLIPSSLVLKMDLVTTSRLWLGCRARVPTMYSICRGDLVRSLIYTYADRSVSGWNIYPHIYIEVSR